MANIGEPLKRHQVIPTRFPVTAPEPKAPPLPEHHPVDAPVPERAPA